MGFLKNLLGKQHTEIVLTYKPDWQKEAELQKNHVLEQVQAKRSAVVRRQAHLPEEHQAHSALIESVRDETMRGSVLEKDIRLGIEKIMGMEATPDEKYEMLDALSTRAVNGMIGNSHEVRMEIGHAYGVVLHLEGKVNLSDSRDPGELDALRKYGGG